MRDRIDERNERERIAKSIIKYWNVNYIPVPKTDVAPEDTEDAAAAEYDKELYRDADDVCGEGDYNSTTDSYSHEYGMTEVEDEVTKGQIEKILHEKTDAIRSLFEQNAQEEKNE